MKGWFISNISGLAGLGTTIRVTLKDVLHLGLELLLRGSLTLIDICLLLSRRSPERLLNLLLLLLLRPVIVVPGILSCGVGLLSGRCWRSGGVLLIGLLLTHRQSILLIHSITGVRLKGASIKSIPLKFEF